LCGLSFGILHAFSFQEVLVVVIATFQSDKTILFRSHYFSMFFDRPTEHQMFPICQRMH
jgi:hypothetical protein